jgi:hypothetical protein
MKKLVVVTAQGHTKEEALAAAGFSLPLHGDATVSYKKANQPVGEALDTFADTYITNRVKGVSNLGFSITVEAGSADSREKPYTVDTVVTKEQRKYKTVYEGFTSDNKLVFTADNKNQAAKFAKKFVTDNKEAVTVRLARVVTSSQPLAMTVSYTPSVNTKLGTYIFFGYEG